MGQSGSKLVMFSVSLCVLLLACGGSKPPPAPPASQDPLLTVYYFHRTVRCPSCLKIEALAKQAVETAFAGELVAGRIGWETVNLDDFADKHFENDYDLQAQSVVLSKMAGGKELRWKNLEQVWDLLEDDAQFVGYVEDEIHAFMQEESKFSDRSPQPEPDKSKGERS